MYTNLRDQYKTTVIIPAMQDSLKATTANYKVDQLITEREKVRQAFQDLLATKLTQYHLTVDSVSITNFAFSDVFQNQVTLKVTAIEAAQTAQNNLVTIQFQAQQQIIQATANATALIMQAQGQANATIIAANATAQQIKLINDQLATSPEFKDGTGHCRFTGSAETEQHRIY
jgi:regulator of protease activity HflC (stomatin/prohibitin superfamily)